MNRKWPRILMVEEDAYIAESLQILYGSVLENGIQDFPEIGHNGECEVAMSFEMARRLLSEEGPFDLVVAHHSAEALELLHFIRWGNAEGPKGTPHNVQVGVNSGYGMEENRQKARKEGFDFFLVKPVSVEEILGQVRKLAKP